MESYQEFMRTKLGNIDSVGYFHSVFVMKEVKNTHGVPVKMGSKFAAQILNSRPLFYESIWLCRLFLLYLRCKTSLDMKTIEDYMAILRKYQTSKSEIYGIIRIGIFGSVARNEQTEDSDVDVCVEMKKPDLFALVHIKEDLQELFGKSVDIVRLRKNMNPMLLSRIQRDGIYA